MFDIQAHFIPCVRILNYCSYIYTLNNVHFATFFVHFSQPSTDTKITDKINPSFGYDHDFMRRNALTVFLSVSSRNSSNRPFDWVLPVNRAAVPLLS